MFYRSSCVVRIKRRIIAQYSAVTMNFYNTVNGTVDHIENFSFGKSLIFR